MNAGKLPRFLGPRSAPVLKQRKGRIRTSANILTPVWFFFFILSHFLNIVEGIFFFFFFRHINSRFSLMVVFSTSAVLTCFFILSLLSHKLETMVKWQHAAAAAAAKSLQSCPTQCNPIDGSPPGSPVPGILQARTLEWLPFPSPMHEW